MALHFIMLIVSALAVELQPFLLELQAQLVEKYSKKTALYRSEKHDLLVTGVGPIMAERTMGYYLEKHHPDEILNIGGAGILDPGLSLNRIFHISNCYSGKSLQREGLSLLNVVDVASCVSMSHPVVNEKEKNDLRFQTGAQLVDMECFTLAGIARNAGIKMHAVKITADHANEESNKIFLESMETGAQLLFEDLKNKL
jgi:nucleoside phosphorylase